MSLLSQYKSYRQSGKPEFELAFRPLFAIDFTNFTGVIESRFNTDYLRYLVTEIDLPNFQVDAEGGYEVKNLAGAFKGIGNVNIVPESNDLTITFLDTERSCFEYFFVPWLEKVVAVDNRGDTPFPRAKLNVYLFKNNTKPKSDFGESDVAIRYEIDGVYPTKVDSPNLSYGDNEVKRSVGFEFNKVRVVTTGGESASWSNGTDEKNIRDIAGNKENKNKKGGIAEKKNKKASVNWNDYVSILGDIFGIRSR